MTAEHGTNLPRLVAGLCDDAAVFPPGQAPVAVVAYRVGLRRTTWYAGLVGPLVVSEDAFGALAGLVPPEEVLPVPVTFPGGPDGIDTVRSACTSFGTCSITEPLADLIDLGLVPAPDRPGGAA